MMKILESILVSYYMILFFFELKFYNIHIYIDFYHEKSKKYQQLSWK